MGKAYFILAVILILFAGMAAYCAASDGDINPWEGKVRPGVVAGLNKGTNTDFFTDVLIPLWGDKQSLLFFNPNIRAREENNEENIGFGYRTFFLKDQAIFGINGYYDSIKTQYNYRYNQVGIGVEALSKWVDFRANYYYPFGTRQHVIDSLNTYSFGNTSIMVDRGLEESFRGFDAEVGVLVPLISDVVETRVFGGGFLFKGIDLKDSEGWKGRVEIRPNKLINLNFEVKDDTQRKTDTFIGAYLEIPFSLEALAKGRSPFEGFKDVLALGTGARSMKERMTEKVVRDRHVVVKGENAGKLTVANGGDNIIYVNQDNTQPGNGDGTLANPYHDISFVPADLRYKPGAIIYVFSYDAHADTYFTNFTLLDNITLWGQGFYNPVWKLGGGPMPIFDGGNNNQYALSGSYNGNGAVITLGNYDEVMGLQIQNGTTGIYGSNIKGAYIHDNLVQGNSYNGIHIENYFSGDDASNLNLRFQFSNNSILNNGGDGIYLSNNVGGFGTTSISNTTITNTFENNTISSNDGNGITLTNNIIAAGSGNLSISNVSISNSFTGNMIGGSTEDDSPSLAEDTFYGNSGYGIAMTNRIAILGGSSITPSISAPAVGLSASITNATITNTLTDNTITGNGDNGVDMLNSIVILTGTGNVDALGAAISYPTATINNSVITNIFDSNTIDGNDGDGVNLTNRIAALSVNAPLVATISNVNISNSFTNNEIVFNNGDGVYLKNAIAALSDISTGGTGVDSLQGVSLMPLSNISNAAISNTFDNNVIAMNHGAGINIERNMIFNLYGSIDGASISNTFTNNEIVENGLDGIVIGGNGPFSGNSIFTVLGPISNASIVNTFDNNVIAANGWYDGGAGVYLQNIVGALAGSITGASISNTFTNNEIVENYGDGVDLYNAITTGIDVSGSAVAANKSAAQAGVGALSGDITNASISNTFDSNTISDNAGYGVYMMNAIVASGAGSVTNASIANTFTNNIISDNGWYNEEGSGIYGQNAIAALNGGSITNASIANTFSDNTIADNYDEGVFMENIISTGGIISPKVDGTTNPGSTPGLVPVGGDITNANITNTFSGNTITDNDAGIVLDNVISANGSLTGGTITNAITNSNTFSGNGGWDVIITDTMSPI